MILKCFWNDIATGQLVWELLEREWVAGPVFCKIFKVSKLLYLERKNAIFAKVRLFDKDQYFTRYSRFQSSCIFGINRKFDESCYIFGINRIFDKDKFFTNYCTVSPPNEIFGMNICQRLIFCKTFKVSPRNEIFEINICQILIFWKLFKVSQLLHIHSLQFLQTFSLTASNYMLVALALDRWLIVESSSSHHLIYLEQIVIVVTISWLVILKNVSLWSCCTICASWCRYWPFTFTHVCSFSRSSYLS